VLLPLMMMFGCAATENVAFASLFFIFYSLSLFVDSRPLSGLGWGREGG
jgi:hypothetical protein